MSKKSGTVCSSVARLTLPRVYELSMLYVDAAGAAAWSVARDADRAAAWAAAWDTAMSATWSAARAAISALIAYDDCDSFLDMPYEKLQVWAVLSEEPRAVLLLPMIYVKEELANLNLQPA